MWATAYSLQFTPHTPRLNHGPPLHRSHPAVSATSIPRRRSYQPPDEDEPHDSVGGRAVIIAFRSQSTTPDYGTRTGKTKLLNEKSLEREEMGKEPSGSDILLALQKASAQNQKKKIGTSTSKSKMKGNTDAAEEEDKDEDYSHVRPINIKTEWSKRLDELEKQLQELSEI